MSLRMLMCLNAVFSIEYLVGVSIAFLKGVFHRYAGADVLRLVHRDNQLWICLKGVFHGEQSCVLIFSPAEGIQTLQRMELYHIILQLINIIYFVCFGAAYVFVATEILNLA